MTKLKQYSLSGAADLQTWDSTSWHNSSMIWDNGGQKWRPLKSGTGISQGTADGRYYPSSLGKALYNFSANKSLYADSGNVRYRFQASSLAYASYNHSANASLHSFTTANYITSTNAISRFYPSTLGKSLMNFSSNKTLYAGSSQVSSRFAPSTLTDTRYDQYVGHSGNTSKHVTTTISSNALTGKHLAVSGVKYTSAYKYINASGAQLANLLASGNEYTNAYSWYNASAQKLSHLTTSGVKYTTAYKYINTSGALLANLLGSGNEYSKAYSYINTSGALLSNLLKSGNEYTQAYKSSQALKIHSFHALISSTYLTTTIQSLITSGTKYTYAYKSSQASKAHAYHAIISSQYIKDYIASSTATGRFADSSNIRSRFPASSTAISKYYFSSLGKGYVPFSSNARAMFYPSALGKSLMNFSSNKTLYANSANVRFRFVESGGTKWVDLTDGGATTLHSHVGGSLAGSMIGNIGSNFTYGISGLKFISSQRISGGSIIVNDLQIYGDTISGLAQPIYNSGAANKKYVDNISGNIRFRFPASSTAISKYAPSALTDTRYDQYVGHSGNTSKHVTTTISSNALTGKHLAVSGVKYSAGYAWYNTSAQKISMMVDSGNEYSKAYSYINTSGALLSNLLKSGNEYTSARKSGQALKIHAFHALISSSYVRLGEDSNAIASGNHKHGLSGMRDFNNWSRTGYHNSGLIWDNTLNKWKAKASGGAGGATTLDALTDVTITTARSGQILQYNQDTAQWVNRLPPMNFNVANVRLLSGQNLNLTRFKCPTGKRVYTWQAAACNSGGASVSGLCIQILSGNTQSGTWGSIYKTSCNVLQQGYPLAKSAIDSNIEIRLMYSGSNTYGQQAGQLQFGTGFMSVSVY